VHQEYVEAHHDYFIFNNSVNEKFPATDIYKIETI
jgi:hypothetical protein